LFVVFFLWGVVFPVVADDVVVRWTEKMQPKNVPSKRGSW